MTTYCRVRHIRLSGTLQPVIPLHSWSLLLLCAPELEQTSWAAASSAHYAGCWKELVSGRAKAPSPFPSPSNVLSIQLSWCKGGRNLIIEVYFPWSKEGIGESFVTLNYLELLTTITCVCTVELGPAFGLFANGMVLSACKRVLSFLNSL